MDNFNSTDTAPSYAPLSEKKENVTPITPKLVELNASRQDLLNKLQNLKQDLQDWRSKLDCQVKNYSEELSELKNSLNTEVEMLRSEFQELRTTLQQQQEDVSASLKNLGLQDEPKIETNGVPAQDEPNGDLAYDEPHRNNDAGAEK